EVAGKTAKKSSEKTGDKVKSKKPAAPEKPAKPAKKSGGDEDEDEDGGKTYGFVQEDPKEEENKPKITYAPDTSIKDLRGPAQAAVVPPTNLVILCGAVGFFGWILLFVMIMIPIVTPVSRDEGTKDAPLKVLEFPEGVGTIGMQGAVSF